MKHRDTKNLQFLMTEIYNIKTNLAPPILHHLFQFHESTLIKKFDLNFRNFREPVLTHDKKTSNYRLAAVKEHYFFELNCHLNVKTQHL